MSEGRNETETDFFENFFRSLTARRSDEVSVLVLIIGLIMSHDCAITRGERETLSGTKSTFQKLVAKPGGY